MIISEEIRKFDIKTLEISIDGVTVKQSSYNFVKFRKGELAKLRKNYTLEALKDNEIIRAYRDFYWRIGIDPTKIRPSSEALVRRILSGRDLPSINNCVDAYNLASAVTFIPMGGYDSSKLSGPLTLRYSSSEEFRGIGGKNYVTGNEIVVADSEKLVSIYPYRDSGATKITNSTKNVLIVLCGVRGIGSDYLRKSAQTTIEIITRFCGGRAKML